MLPLLFSLLLASVCAVKDFNGQYTMTTSATIANNAGQNNVFVYWSWTQAMMKLSFGPSSTSPRWLETYQYNDYNQGFIQVPTQQFLFTYSTTCSPNCASQGLATSMPPFDIANSSYLNAFTTITATACGATRRYTPKTGVWTNIVTQFDAKTDGTICSFTLTDGRQFELVSGTFAFTCPTIAIPSGCTCNQAIDIEFLIDRSGSINGTEMQIFRVFVNTFLAGLTIGPDAVWVGMTHFSTVGGVGTTFAITGDNATVYAGLTTWASQCPNSGSGGTNCYLGGTATAAGMVKAAANLYVSQRNVPKLIITLTDGGQNTKRDGYSCNGLTTSCDADIAGAMAIAKAYSTATKPLTFICAGIGVACTHDVNQCLSPRNILAFADGIVGNNLSVSSWASLSTMTQSLTQQTCTSSNNIASTTCTSTCCGLCICGVCQKPDSCGTNLCETYAVGSSCCAATPKAITTACGTASNCFLNSCNKSLNNGAGGCVSSPQTCNVANTGCNGCTSYSCNPATSQCTLADSSACLTPVDCQYSAWTAWTTCTATCGGGTATHTRTVTAQPQNCGLACDTSAASLTGSTSCGTTLCPVQCVWSAWSAFSSCSASCGTGTQTQTRTIITEAANGAQPCGNVFTNTTTCNTQLCPVNCAWGSWSAYGTCSATCGGGIQTSTRVIATAAANGGNICLGATLQTQACNTQNCPIDCVYGPWSAYSVCTLLCLDVSVGIPGVSVRTRVVLVAGAYGGIGCDNSTLSQSTPCNTNPCAINCSYGDWATWSACSVSCGDGVRYQTRSVSVPAQFGGSQCDPAGASQSQACNLGNCPVDCVYNQWSDWSESACSAQCEGGIQNRTRTSVAAQFGGVACDTAPSTYLQTRVCNTQVCDRNCSYTPWSGFGACSLTCGTGSQTNTRTITVAATGAGTPCAEIVQTQDCNTNPCPVDCVVSTWTIWSPCSVTCGPGITTRNRTVTTSSANGGALCPTLGDSSDCNDAPCPINCVGVWSEWSNCDCGTPNTRSKSFTITIAAQYGGTDCGSNPDIVDNTCTTPICDQDCVGTWSSWSTCSCTTSTRSHTFTVTNPKKGTGAECRDGSNNVITTGSSESESCVPTGCPVDCVGAWSGFSDCACNNGVGSKYETFIITTASQYNGAQCAESNETKRYTDCSNTCPTPCVGSWGSWGTCACGTTSQSRTYSITQPLTNGGAACEAVDGETGTQPCTPQSCPVDCVGAWTEWTECDCVSEKRNGTYRITTPREFAGADCPEGDGTFREEACAKPCVDCQGSWSSFSTCSCASSSRSQTFTITTFASGPPHVGVACAAENNAVFTEACTPSSCPVDCAGAWGSWTTCDCTNSSKNRFFEIVRELEFAGADCPLRGQMEDQACTPVGCPVDCVGAWGAWGDCDCQTLVRKHYYEVSTPALNGGAVCDPVAGTEANETCTRPSTCPTDCVWSWTAWSNCSCTGNNQNRTVNVSTPSSNGGLACPNSTDYQVCTPVNCPVDCVGSWSAFGACSCTPPSEWNRTFTQTTPSENGGADCPALNGAVDIQSCTPTTCVVDCVGSFSAYSNCSCTTKTRTRNFTIITGSQNGGENCVAGNNSVETTSCTPPSDCPDYGPTCVNASGCDDGKPCTVDACLMKPDGLLHCDNSQPVVCNDNNTCTSDVCDPISGCTYPQRLFCDDFNVCTNETCHPINGCVYVNITCPNISACYLGTCNPTLGCDVEERECRNSSSTNNSCLSYSCNPNATNQKYCVETDVCTFPIIYVGIAAGAIAGIVVGAVICAALCSGATYAFAHQATALDAVATTTNPLYAPSGQAGDNPMFIETPRAGGDA